MNVCIKRVIFLFLGVLAFCLTAKPAAADWPQWRGPNLNGTAEAEGLPVVWGPEMNIAWKTELPSWTGSTPIVIGDKVFVMSPSEQPAEPETQAQDNERGNRGGPGNRRGGFGGGRFGGGAGGPGGPELLLYCLSLKDGSEIWSRKVDTGNAMSMKANRTSPSPVTDGQHVWVTTGNGRVSAYDMAGERKWTLNLKEKYGDFRFGFDYASSPLLLDGKLIYQVVHGRRGPAESYLLALNPATGEELWRVVREDSANGESNDAYTTPGVVEVDGEKQILVLGADVITGHNPATGEELWRGGGLNPRDNRAYRIVPSPFAVSGIIVAPTRKVPMLAFRAGGSGDISESHLAWKYEDGSSAPDVPTPVSDGTHLYVASEQGRLTCLKLNTGEVVWGPEELGTGTISASPLLADGKLYLLSEAGETVVVEAGPVFNVLARNKLTGEFTMSSPVAVGSRLLIRSGKTLWAIDG